MRCTALYLSLILAACSSSKSATEPDAIHSKVGWQLDKVAVNGREFLLPIPPNSVYNSERAGEVKARVAGLLEAADGEFDQAVYEEINTIPENLVEQGVTEYYLTLRAANGLLDARYLPATVGEASAPTRGLVDLPKSSKEQAEPNNDRSTASPLAPNGSGAGSLRRDGDPVDCWRVIAAQDGLLTVSCKTTSAKVGKSSVRSVRVLDHRGERLKGKTAPYQPNSLVEVGTVSVLAGDAIFIEVECQKQTGSFAEYKIETSFDPS